nr:MAG TPA: hypothetical protein [Caudoviricetes sp.]
MGVSDGVRPAGRFVGCGPGGLRVFEGLGSRPWAQHGVRPTGSC